MSKLSPLPTVLQWSEMKKYILHTGEPVCVQTHASPQLTDGPTVWAGAAHYYHILGAVSIKCSPQMDGQFHYTYCSVIVASLFCSEVFKPCVSLLTHRLERIHSWAQNAFWPLAGRPHGLTWLQTCFGLVTSPNADQHPLGLNKRHCCVVFISEDVSGHFV